MRMRPVLPVDEVAFTEDDKTRFSKVASFVVMRDRSGSTSDVDSGIQAGMTAAAVYEAAMGRVATSRAFLDLSLVAKDQGHGAVLARLRDVDLTKQVLPRRQRAPHPLLAPFARTGGTADMPGPTPAERKALTDISDIILEMRDLDMHGATRRFAVEALQTLTFASDLDGKRYLAVMATGMADGLARGGVENLYEHAGALGTRPSEGPRP